MSLSALIDCTGTWNGINTLQDPHTNAPAESVSMARVTPVLDGRFVRFDYTWSYEGKPQTGSLLFGFDQKEQIYSAYWIDSWHMGNKAMECRGLAQEGGIISVRGSYAAPPGPDWGWRIDLFPVDGITLKMVMYNIWPEGQEDLAVEAEYTRVLLSDTGELG